MAKQDAAPAAQEKIPVTRREFLNLAWLASLGFFLLPVGGVTILFAYPRFKAGEFGGEFPLGDISALPEVNQSPISNTKGKFWLTRTDQGVHALYKVCVHLGCLYNWEETDFKFLCPCHGSQYQYNGKYILGPAPRSLDQFVMRAEKNGEVLAETANPNEALPVFADDPDVRYIVDTGKKIIGQPHS
ncbi:MAG: Rieske 2Fe-2S domain-containing protein [Anaerolineales bacterium]